MLQEMHHVVMLQAKISILEERYLCRHVPILRVDWERMVGEQHGMAAVFTITYFHIRHPQYCNTNLLRVGSILWQ